jgi:hypothetical protein
MLFLRPMLCNEGDGDKKSYPDANGNDCCFDAAICNLSSEEARLLIRFIVMIDCASPSPLLISLGYFRSRDAEGYYGEDITPEYNAHRESFSSRIEILSCFPTLFWWRAL